MALQLRGFSVSARCEAIFPMSAVEKRIPQTLSRGRVRYLTSPEKPLCLDPGYRDEEAGLEISKGEI